MRYNLGWLYNVLRVNILIEIEETIYNSLFMRLTGLHETLEPIYKADITASFYRNGKLREVRFLVQSNV